MQTVQSTEKPMYRSSLFSSCPQEYIVKYLLLLMLSAMFATCYFKRKYYGEDIHQTF